ncbi:MAG: hypothetical protein ACRDYA_12615 [Egibacteraceae bacterium]
MRDAAYCRAREEGATVADALDLYTAVAAETEPIVAEIVDLGQPVPVP